MRIEAICGYHIPFRLEAGSCWHERMDLPIHSCLRRFQAGFLVRFIRLLVSGEGGGEPGGGKLKVERQQTKRKEREHVFSTVSQRYVDLDRLLDSGCTSTRERACRSPLQ